MYVQHTAYGDMKFEAPHAVGASKMEKPTSVMEL
jgi:hypothetical protein